MFSISEIRFFTRRIFGFILRKERADYIINSYYMKISLARLLKHQKISMQDYIYFKIFNRVSINISFFDAELYRHHTAFTIKIVFDWIYIPIPSFYFKERKTVFFSNRIF